MATGFVVCGRKVSRAAVDIELEFLAQILAPKSDSHTVSIVDVPKPRESDEQQSLNSVVGPRSNSDENDRRVKFGIEGRTDASEAKGGGLGSVLQVGAEAKLPFARQPRNRLLPDIKLLSKEEAPEIKDTEPRANTANDPKAEPKVGLSHGSR